MRSSPGEEDHLGVGDSFTAMAELVGVEGPGREHEVLTPWGVVEEERHGHHAPTSAADAARVNGDHPATIARIDPGAIVAIDVKCRLNKLAGVDLVAGVQLECLTVFEPVNAQGGRTSWI